MKKLMMPLATAFLTVGLFGMFGCLSPEEQANMEKRRAEHQAENERRMTEGLWTDVRVYLPPDAKDLKNEPNGWVSFTLDRHGKTGHYMARTWYGSHNERAFAIVRTD